MTPTRSDPAVVVVGSGPAGAAAAIALLRRGIPVAIVERSAFPRVKVCGEFISPAATDLLESLIPPAELLAAGARRIDAVMLDMPGAPPTRWAMPRPAWAISRASLDTRLTQRARAAGAEVIQPAAVRDVRYSDSHAEIVLNAGRILHADAVIHADGTGRFDPAGPIPMRPGVIGLKCHFRPRADADLACVGMRAAPGAYIGVIAVESGLATCAVTASVALFRRHAGDADAMLRDCWPRWDPTRRVGDWRHSGIGASGYIDPGHPRSFRVGNAAAAVEPIGGEGIGLALWAGLTLGDTLDPRRPHTMRLTQRTFALAYRRRLRLRRPVCRLAAACLMHPRCLAPLRPMLTGRAIALTPWWALSGKPF